jgi:hypothetical protein
MTELEWWGNVSAHRTEYAAHDGGYEKKNADNERAYDKSHLGLNPLPSYAPKLK